MIKITGSIGSFTLSWDPINIPDVLGYVVCGVPGVEDFAVSGSNILNVGPETSFTYYTSTSGMFSVKVACYDSFSNPKALILSDLNFSTLQTVEVLGLLSETLDALTGQLTESQLHSDLSGRIDLIDLPTLGLVDRLDQEILDREGAVAQEAQDRATALTSYYTKVEADSATASAITGATSSLISNSSLATSLSSYYTKTEADSATASAITGATSEFITNSSLASSLTSYYTKTAADSAIATYVDVTSATIQGLVSSASIESNVRASTTGPDWDSGTVYTKGKVVVFTVGTEPYLFQRITSTGGTPSPSVVDGVAQTTTDWKPVAANLYAETMLKTDVNGHVVGVGIANDGVTGEVEILADKFKIVHPTLPATSAQVFTVGTVDGVTGQVGIRGELLIDGSLLVSENVSVGGTLSIGGATVSFAAPTPVGIGAVETSLGNAPAGILNSNVTATSIGAVKTDASNAPAGILNSSISISSAGVLSGGGGGTVTLTGLGYAVPTYDLIGGTKPAADADKTSSILGDTGTLTLNAALTINSLLTISGSAAGITSGLASYSSDGTGFWISKDTSNSRMRAGTVSAGVLTNGFVWDGTAFKVKGEIQATSGTFSGNITSSATITGGILQTSAEGSRRFVVSSTTNQAEFWGDGGGGVVKLAAIGIDTYLGLNSAPIASFGNNTTSLTALVAESGTGVGLMGLAASGYGAWLGQDVPGDIYRQGLDGFIGASPCRLAPGNGAGAPTHNAYIGSLWVDQNGVLYIQTAWRSGSTWQKVGAQ